jgi:hypothetical protein
MLVTLTGAHHVTPVVCPAEHPCCAGGLLNGLSAFLIESLPELGYLRHQGGEVFERASEVWRCSSMAMSASICSTAFQMQRSPELRICATLGEEPEVELV